ncbi:MAG: hypothetical protein LHW60_07350 [Candidatus Cloacimonetes bacterium]|nr:hypothetical protein [Candidatus Cloacimonadota bacterium]
MIYLYKEYLPKYLFYTFLILFLIQLFSCESSSSKKDGGISGTVALFGESDCSGVVVSLYSLAVPDSSCNRIWREHRHIGVELKQENIFEHTDNVPLYSTLSSVDGKFSIANIKPGTYNLVAEKEGWGHRHIYSIDVSNDQKNGFWHPTSIINHTMMNVETDEIILYPVVEVFGIYSEEFMFQKDRIYVVSQDAIFEAPVIVEGGSEIRVNPDVELRFLSTVVSSDNGLYAKLMKNKVSGQDQRRWNGIELYSHDNVINNWILKDANTGIQIFGDNTSIQSSMFENNGVAVQAVAINSNINNCLFYDIDDRGFGLNQSAGSDVIEHVLHNNIFYNTFCGLRTNGHAVSIKHNYFVDCEEGIVSSNEYHVIERNSFDRNKKAIICNGSHSDIKENNFYYNTNSISFETAYYVGRSNPRIINNNFYQSSGYAIRLALWTAEEDIDATLNYWFSNNIDKLIYDKHDSPALEYEVLYLPKLNRVIAGIGV